MDVLSFGSTVAPALVQIQAAPKKPLTPTAV
jgi:hypothetical protein